MEDSRFIADFDDLNMSGPTVGSMLRWIGRFDLVEADEEKQKAALLGAVEDRQLAPLEIVVLRNLGWLPKAE